VDPLDPAVERQLPEEEIGAQQIRPDHVFRRQDADGNGEVEPRALFPDVRRGKIDGDMMTGKGIAGTLDRRLDPFPAFPDGHVGQAHRGELGKPRGGIDLDIDEVAINADYGTAQDFYDHNAPEGKIAVYI